MRVETEKHRPDGMWQFRNYNISHFVAYLFAKIIDLCHNNVLVNIIQCNHVLLA